MKKSCLKLSLNDTKIVVKTEKQPKLECDILMLFFA